MTIFMVLDLLVFHPSLPYYQSHLRCLSRVFQINQPPSSVHILPVFHLWLFRFSVGFWVVFSFLVFIGTFPQMTFCQFLDLAFTVCPHWQHLSLRPLPVFEVGLLAFIPASWCHAYTGTVKTLTTKMWDIFLSGVFINCKCVTPPPASLKPLKTIPFLL